MKFVKLHAPRVIAGINRHPAEGPLPFDDDTVDAIVKDKAGVEVDEEGNEIEPEGDDADGLDDLKLPDLTAIVTKEGVPLNGATKKDDLIAAIRAHRNPAAAE
uniref:hypothetical protein n=1 Tax=uncultured Sphingomonas sp. TaxID=158754 RepID=UPI0035CCA2E1